MQHTEQADVEQAFFGQIEAPTSSIHSRSPFIPPPCANTLPGDEERTGNPLQMARADMVSMGKRADYALSFEGSNKHDGVDAASIGAARRADGCCTSRASRRIPWACSLRNRVTARSTRRRASSTRFASR